MQAISNAYHYVQSHKCASVVAAAAITLLALEILAIVYESPACMSLHGGPAVVNITLLLSAAAIASTHHLASRLVPSGETITIGSEEKRLSAAEIESELNRLNQRSCHTLVIYGKGDTKLVTEGARTIGRLNPYKLILVGATIEETPRVSLTIESQLSKKEWLQSQAPRRSREENEFCYSLILQLSVASVECALADSPPSRGWFKGPYHVVYVVSKES